MITTLKISYRYLLQPLSVSGIDKNSDEEEEEEYINIIITPLDSVSLSTNDKAGNTENKVPSDSNIQVNFSFMRAAQILSSCF